MKPRRTALLLPTLHATAADSLARPSPTLDAKPLTASWWMGSAVDKATITRELTEFHEAGLGGVEVGMLSGAKGGGTLHRLRLAATKDILVPAHGEAGVMKRFLVRLSRVIRPS